MTIPAVPSQDPGQGTIDLPNIANPYLSVWWTTQTASNLPEEAMQWLVAQGWEITGVSYDTSTTPPTARYAIGKQGMQPWMVLLSLCNSYTVAANEARDANEIRYNQIITGWTDMMYSTQTHFEAQVTEQNTSAGVFLTDLDTYMSAIESLIDDNTTQIVTDAATATTALTAMDAKLSDLESNVTDTTATITALLTDQSGDVDAHILAVQAVLDSLETDYATVSADIDELVASVAALVATHVTDYDAVLMLLETDYDTHSRTASAFLTDLGATDLARINEEFAAKLSVQLQKLVDDGMSTSLIAADITARNTRDRDEQIQLLNDRLNREKLDNQHKLYDQQVAMRKATMDGKDRMHAVQQEVLRYRATQVTGTYALLQDVRNRTLAGKQAIHAAQDTLSRFSIATRDELLKQLQAAVSGLIAGKERYAAQWMQTASALAEHKHKAIVERMNTAVARLDGWKDVAAENRRLMAYQLDERNKLLVGLYAFVERRDDNAPEWKDMASMIAGLGDAAGGWLQP